MPNLAAIRVVSTSNVIEQVLASGTPDIQLSEPVALDSPADALDAPFNPQDVVEGLQVLSAIFTTATAAVAFLKAVLGSIRVSDAEVAEIRDPFTDELIAVITKDTPEEELAALVEA